MAFARKRYLTLTFSNRHRFYYEGPDVRYMHNTKLWGGGVLGVIIDPDAITADMTTITIDQTDITADQTRY